MPPKGRSSSRSHSHSKPSFSFSKPSSFGRKRSPFMSRNRIHSKGHFGGGRRRFNHHRVGSTGAIVLCNKSASYVLPVLNAPFFVPGKISFSGVAVNLRNQLATLGMDQRNSVREVVLCIQGTLVQEEKTCCKALTVMAGIMCVIPFLFMCCDCYERNTERIWTVPLTDYEIIADVLRQFPYLQSVKLFIQDNHMTPQKSNVLESGLCPSVFSFVFNNCCIAFDIDNNEQTNFQLLFNNIKQNKGILTSILWDDNYYMTQDFQPPPTQGPNMGIPIPVFSNYVNSDPFSLMMGNQMAGQMGGMMAGQMPPPPMMGNPMMGNNLMPQMSPNTFGGDRTPSMLTALNKDVSNVYGNTML